MSTIEWVQRLETVRFDLTKREQEIVAYLEDHVDTVPQLSMQDLVNATNTSRSTVHRFCVKMGYSGFKAFKEAVQHFTRSLKPPQWQLTPKLASDAALSDHACEGRHPCKKCLESIARA
ncbi:hypothetical protein GF339_08015 [candidate division KSB3 bacterium]|uniref:HTH rpiR-type domain-containing protein n=1 Tax=candidate division KSB3 bacterium TaxID=2044937 RepID=A0A9D5JUQ4_9BACT|nr:hypothetical protein [candidate division KSB3 bacterium]MBD3324515.1 hypothetical protein [candidate division KSB3 bacterium]